MGDQQRHWHEGQDLLFDDTLPHSAENADPEDTRVVLFLDVPRPFAGAAILARLSRAVAYACLFPWHPDTALDGRQPE